MEIETVENIYKKMLKGFPSTFEKTSIDSDNYMTSCQKEVVNFDRFKKNFVKKLSLPEPPRSCDALYMNNKNEFFMVEFKNGKIDEEELKIIREKILESLLIFSEKFSKTANFMRDNISFILVYNEITNAMKINKYLSNLASTPPNNMNIFGLKKRFKKLYFKEVYTYSKEEFESEFVSNHC